MPERCKSASSIATTSPEFAYGESRRDKLMPLTTTPSGSVAAGTIQPPGHMQNENAPRLSSGVNASRYAAAGSFG